jgi:hypothetical protein
MQGNSVFYRRSPCRQPQPVLPIQDVLCGQRRGQRVTTCIGRIVDNWKDRKQGVADEF